jgi:hypothetical protein
MFNQEKLNISYVQSRNKKSKYIKPRFQFDSVKSHAVTKLKTFLILSQLIKAKKVVEILTTLHIVKPQTLPKFNTK